MSLYTSTISQGQPAGIQINEDDRVIVCDHTDRPIDGGDDALCPSCTRQSYAYWGNLITLWKLSMSWYSGASYNPKLDWLLDYVLATNDLKDAGFHPPLGYHPRLGLNVHDTAIILWHCPQKPFPLGLMQCDTQDPPSIVPHFRSFLTDISRPTNEGDVAYPRDINSVHRRLAKAYIKVFFDSILDSVEDGENLKAFLGTTWIQHILASKGFHDLELSQVVGKFEMDRWLEWVFKEGWKNSVKDSDGIKINPIELVSAFVTAFTDVPESHLSENITALDLHLNHFLNRHFVEDLDNAEMPIPSTLTQFSFRYISCSFYLHALHSGTNRIYDGYLILPSHLHLSRLQIINLLTFNNLERNRAHQLVMNDGNFPSEVAVNPEYLDDYPVLRLTPDPCVDQIFQCEGIFKIWKEGERPTCIWRGRKETHEDLAVCAFEVLVNTEWATKPAMEGVHEYAKYTWSYHLSLSSPTLALIAYVEKFTQAYTQRKIALDDTYCDHTSLVTKWLEEAYVQFPFNYLNVLLFIWKRIASAKANPNVGGPTVSRAGTSSAIPSPSMPCPPPRIRQGGDCAPKTKERSSPYAKARIMKRIKDD